jgi:hypothetical protein
VKYVDWVARCWKTAAEMLSERDSYRLAGVPHAELARRLDSTTDPNRPEFHGSPEWQALVDATRDLEDLFLADSESATWHIKLTEEGRKGRSARIEALWPQMFDIHLDDELAPFLAVACGLCEKQYEKFASVQWVMAEEVYRQLGWTWPDIDRVHDITQRLAALHLIRTRPASGGYIGVQPTYGGIVRATEKAGAEGQALLQDLVATGESTNVEFKRELRLDRDREKAEFVRDVLGLGNVQLHGARRFIVVGFEDESMRFYETPDPSLSHERLEQVLHAYAVPPTIATQSVAWPGGRALVIEILRDARRVPYRATRDFGGRLRARAAYVRHGRHTVEASDAEVADLNDEAARANVLVYIVG